MWGFEPWLPIHMGNVGKFTTTTSTLLSDRAGKYYSSEDMQDKQIYLLSLGPYYCLLVVQKKISEQEKKEASILFLLGFSNISIQFYVGKKSNWIFQTGECQKLLKNQCRQIGGMDRQLKHQVFYGLLIFDMLIFDIHNMTVISSLMFLTKARFCGIVYLLSIQTVKLLAPAV